MELIFVRHGDPDYSIDSLTERGWKEAESLVDRFKDIDVTEFFVSTMGRAKDTASFTLKSKNREAIPCNWLREFMANVNITENPELAEAFPDTKVVDGITYANVAWDMNPAYFAVRLEYYHPEDWKQSAVAKSGNFMEVYEYVTTQFDKLLAEHGYVREGNLYKAVRSNREKLVFFCHYGVTCLLLSYLMNVSPFILWHSISFAPTAVTSIFTEERKEGIAYFRANKIGDISHLYAKNIEPSFACRFCETFDSDERH